MTMTQYEISRALQLLVDGHLGIEDVLTLAEQDKAGAQYRASDLVSDLSAQQQLGTPGGLKLLTVLWLLVGPDQCLNFHFAALQPRAVLDQFIQQRLTKVPDEFSDRALLLVRKWFRNGSLNQLVHGIEASRLSRRAQHLRRAPLELMADVGHVKQRVSAYQFNPDLNELLDKVEEGLAGDGDGFDQAALLKHLRTFFEKLHMYACERVQQVRPDTQDKTPLNQCANAIDFMRRRDVLTERMAMFGKSLYGVLSNEGVHAIKAEREYARLCRNMVAEYALVLFFELDRRLG